MKLLRKLLFVFISIFALLNPALASDSGSADEAVAQVKKAAAFIKANGQEKAFAAFNDPNGGFKDRDLYIVAMDFTGKMLAHGANAKLIGKNLMELRDSEGKYFVKEYLAFSQTKGSGWVDFKWPNPVSKEIEQKSLYVEKVGDIVVGCGIYKK